MLSGISFREPAEGFILSIAEGLPYGFSPYYFCRGDALPSPACLRNPALGSRPWSEEPESPSSSGY